MAEGQRITYLDGLRGIAALAVVLNHMAYYIGADGGSWANAAVGKFDIGKAGVVLFFLISGFVIPFSLKGPSPLRSFMITRAARLLPALWLSIAVALAMGIGPRTDDPLGMVAANMLMVAEPLGFELIVLPYWTLQWELGFYVLCMVLYASGRLSDPKVLGCAMIAATLAALAAPNCIYLAFMFAGTLVRLAFHEGRQNARIWLAAGSAALALRLIAPSVGLIAPAYAPAFVAALAVAVLVFAWTVAYAPQCPPLMVRLGELSYSIYLFHIMILVLVQKQIGALDGAGAQAAYIAVGMAAAVGGAILVHDWIERPFNQLGKRLALARRPSFASS